MSKIKETALRQLHARSARLARLLELEAPEVVVAHEIQLIVNSIKLYAPEAYARAVMEQEQLMLKAHAGYCGAAGCEAPLKHQAIDMDYCVEHGADEEPTGVYEAPTIPSRLHPVPDPDTGSLVPELTTADE